MLKGVRSRQEQRRRPTRRPAHAAAPWCSCDSANLIPSLPFLEFFVTSLFLTNNFLCIFGSSAPGIIFIVDCSLLAHDRNPYNDPSCSVLTLCYPGRRGHGGAWSAGISHGRPGREEQLCVPVRPAEQNRLQEVYFCRELDPKSFKAGPCW